MEESFIEVIITAGVKGERTCLARNWRSRLPEAKKGESGGKRRRSGYQYRNPNSASFSWTTIAISFPLCSLNYSYSYSYSVCLSVSPASVSVFSSTPSAFGVVSSSHSLVTTSPKLLLGCLFKIRTVLEAFRPPTTPSLLYFSRRKTRFLYINKNLLYLLSINFKLNVLNFNTVQILHYLI